MIDILDEILIKAGLKDNEEAENVMAFVESAYPEMTEEVLERYIGMLNMLYPLKNYFALIREYCPSSLKNDATYQKTAASLIGYLRRTVLNGKV